VGIDIDLLREFVVLADELHFSRAARRLYISQPTLSKHIARLEAALQTPLLVRGARMHLTPAGEELLAASKDIIYRYDAAIQAINRVRERRHLRVAGPFQCQFLRDLVLSAANELSVESDVDVHLVDTTPATALELVQKGKADVAAVCGLDCESADLNSQEMARARMAVALQTEHPKTNRANLTMADLAELPVVTPGGPYDAWRAGFLDLCAAHRLATRTLTRHGNRFDLRLDPAADEAIVTCEYAPSFLSFPGFSIHPIQDADAVYVLRAYWSPTNTKPSLALLLDLLLDPEANSAAS
jgi:DNA-binding transcriptional LysR family regulator